MPDSKTISLLKAISWRTTGSLATFVIVLYATGRLDLAAVVGGSETIIKIVLFYVHERVWTRIVALPYFSKPSNYSKVTDYNVFPSEEISAA